MGSGNSTRQKVLEPYTSFDVLPSEYFNRRALQQQFSQPQQLQQAQAAYAPTASYAPQQFYQPSVQQPQSYYYSQPPQPQQMFATQGVAQPYGYNQSQVFAGRPVGYMAPPPQSQGIGRQLLSLPRRQFGLGGATPQQIQSVPKFNQSGPVVKF